MKSDSLTSHVATVAAPAPAPAARQPGNLLAIGLPGLLLLVAFVVPVLLLLRASFAPTAALTLWDGTSLDSYIALGQSAVRHSIINALMLALIVATGSTVIGYPLAYLIVGSSRRMQSAWLILVLATLSLSDVLITFSWQVMLARRLWLFKLLVWLGLVDAGSSLTPSFGATLFCVMYVAIPFSVLILYPALSKLDRQMIEAARTMGATPSRVFFSVVVPNTRSAIALGFTMACVLSLGAYVMPLVLGRPQDWTLAVLISNAAMNTDDLPGASAMAVALLGVTLTLAGSLWLALRKRTTQ